MARKTATKSKPPYLVPYLELTSQFGEVKDAILDTVNTRGHVLLAKLQNEILLSSRIAVDSEIMEDALLDLEKDGKIKLVVARVRDSRGLKIFVKSVC